MQKRRRQCWLSWSSGKDSAYCLVKLKSQPELEVTGLFTTVTEAFNRVAMHSTRVQLLKKQAETLNLPLEIILIPSPCPNEVYENKMRELLEKAKAAGVSTMAFGDLFLQDIRTYRECMLQGTGIDPIFPLWGSSTADLGREMISKGQRAILTCVDPRKLNADFAGREFDLKLLEDLPKDVDPCGENGEFHTFVYDSPAFKKPIPYYLGERVEREGFVFQDVQISKD